MTDKQLEQLNEQLGVIDDLLEQIIERITGIEDRIADINSVVHYEAK